MFTLKFTTGIRPTERNMKIARAAQIYYHQGAYSDEKLVEQQKPVEQKSAEKPEDKKPVEQKKPEVKPVEQKKPEAKAEQQKPEKPVEQKADQKPEVKPVEQKKPAEQKKPVVEKKPDIEVLDRKGNVVAMLPGVPEEAPKAARTTGFDINNFVKPKQSKQQAPEEKLGQAKGINEVYYFIRSKGVGYPFDPMPGFSVTEKVSVLKKYANFNGTHPGLDVIQLNTLIMVFNSPDLSRKMINCGLDPKQVLGVKKFNEVPVSKYDNSDTYDFAFEYSIAKKKKLVLLLNSIPTYDSKNGWMSAYNISLH